MMNQVGLSLQAPMGQMASREMNASMTPALEAANSSRAAMFGKVQTDLNKMMDYKAGAKAGRELDNLRDGFERRLQEGLTAAPGSPKSFFLADGSEDEDKTAAFYSEMRDAFAAVEPTFISPEAAVKWQEDKAGYMQNAENRLKGQIGQHALRSIRQAFDERHEALVAQGDTYGALRNLKDAEDAGIISGNRAATERYKLEQDAMMRQVGMAYMTPGHADFLKLYDDPDFRSKLSYENLMKLDAMAGKLQTQPRSTVKSAGTASDGTPKAKKVVEPPLGLPS